MCSIVLCLITDQMTVLTNHVLHGALWGLSLVGPGSSRLHSHCMLQQSHEGWATYPHQTLYLASLPHSLALPPWWDIQRLYLSQHINQMGTCPLAFSLRVQ